MNQKLSVIILAGGFSTSLAQFNPGTPKALIPLGHNPCICILIESILELSSFIDKIYVLFFKKYKAMFEKEIKRWFQNMDNIIMVSQDDPPGTGKSIELFLQEHDDSIHENLLILHSNMPLLSKTTMKDFITESFIEKADKNILISKINNYKEYHQVEIQKERVQKIVDKSDQVSNERPFCFMNTIFIKKSILQSLVPRIPLDPFDNEYKIYKMVELDPDGFQYFVMNPYIANKECVLIYRQEDKNFAEEIYLEYRNTIFIHQCYGLWKKCEIFENRINQIEDVLVKNNII